MESAVKTQISPRQHISDIFDSFKASARVLESFTNLSNTVIDTALSGQNKFVFEILQNADDAFNDQCTDITLQLILQDDYLIIQHNGKEFDFYDVERICDYASQIKDVKAKDLSKTGYKGVGFKSLFNLTNCIYIHSGGYSFRFDKTYWHNPDSIPWQVIPIWNNRLPLNENYNFTQSVNFILKVQKAKRLEKHLREVIDHPEYFLYLRHVNNFRVNLFGDEHFLERKVESYGIFIKYNFYRDHSIVNTWLSRVFASEIPDYVQSIVRKGSKYTYPDKIKEATQIPIVFTIKTDESMKEVMKLRNSICFNTLPTQVQLTLPYHINSYFILNLDRTQLDENDFNEFIFNQIGYLQLNLLKDLAIVPHLKNFVAELYIKKISHPYFKFNKAFSNGLYSSKSEIGWLPAHEGSHLLKLEEAWIDEIQFFKQNFRNVRDEISRKVISYDVTKQYLLPIEVKRFTYDKLFQEFPKTYNQELTDDSYVKFINYLYKRLKSVRDTSSVICNLRDVAFLRTKNGTLSSPKNALLEEINNPVHDIFELNPLNNEYLPQMDGDLIRDWLAFLGAKRLRTPVDILRESLFKWIENDLLELKITFKSHIFIINYIAENSEPLTKEERKKLKENLLVLTESKEFKLMKTCYLPEAFPVKELEKVISDDKKICPVYNMTNLKNFLGQLGIYKKLTPHDLFLKSILEWIKNNEIKFKLNTNNYTPIVYYFASRYSEIENKLTENERSDMKKMPVLTCAQVFQRGDLCYFDSVLPDVPDFRNAIPKENLVCSKSISKDVRAFISKIGVSDVIKPIDLIRKSVFKWIKEDTVKRKINSKNHLRILNYIAEKWETCILPELEQHEEAYFMEFPILTKNNRFKEACECYWQTDDNNIPNIDSIITLDDLVSSEYDTPKIKKVLEDDHFDIHYISFPDIWNKYCKILISRESINWFFLNLRYYWESRCTSNFQILNDIKQELCRSYILAKDGCRYLPTELYSFRFSDIYSIHPNSLPLLECEIPELIPEDLEKFLGFKTELGMTCIMNLLEAFDSKQKEKTIGEEKTAAFFNTLLEQLKLKDVNEIKKYSLKLLSRSNKLTLAENLYYFQEENAECTLDKYYLKRIDRMSHNDTLELAKLCGVNILPFQKTVTFKKEKPVTTLKEFYLERLPLIALKEAKERNSLPSEILKRLYESISLIELFECEEICAKYPFGDAVKERFHFENSKIYVSSKWRSQSSRIHPYIKNELCLKTDIGNIIDMTSVSEEKEEWLQFESEDPDAIGELYELEKELKNLLWESEDLEVTDDEFSDLEIVDSAEPPQAATNYFRRDQTASSISEHVSKQENEKTASHEPFNSKSKENISNSSLNNLNLNFIKEQIPYANTQTKFLGKEYKNFDKQLLDSKYKQNVTNPLQQDTDSDSVGEQTASSYSEQFSEDEIESVICQPLNSKSNETVTNNRLQQDINNDFRREQIASSYFEQFPETERTEFKENISDSLMYDLNVNFKQEQVPCGNTQAEFLRLPDRNFNGQFFDLTSTENITNPQSQKSNSESGQERAFNTLKEFYIQKLPLIVIGELKKRNESPYTILKQLYDKIMSIEVFPFECINKKVNCFANPKCYFNGLKIYIPGKWTDYKAQIHKHIIKELCLNSNVAEIINMELIKGDSEDWITFENENPQLFDQLEESLRKLLKKQIKKETNTSCEVEDELQRNTITLKKASDEISSEKLLENDKQYSINAGIRSEVSVGYTQEQETLDFERKTENFPLDTIRTVDNSVRLKELQWRRPLEQDSHNSPMQKPTVEFGPVNPGFKFHIQRFNESSVFTFLQDYYKCKYPNARCNLFGDRFTLQWESHKVEIIWLNKCGDRELPYDFILIKDGQSKEIIEVQSHNKAIVDYFKVNDNIFIDRNQLIAKQQQFKEKYCIYCVFNMEDSVQTEKERNEFSALYKIVPLKCA